MKFRFLILLMILTSSGFYNVNAQEYPFYRTYMFNGALYNPAEVGRSKYIELNVNYMQEWTGFENAPTLGSFNLQIPTYSQISFGVGGYMDKTVLLNSGSFSGMVSYQVPLSKWTNISFGISAGMTKHSYEPVVLRDENDDVIRRLSGESAYLNGQFGMLFNWKDLNVGFSLPKLFNNDLNAETGLENVAFDQFQTYVVYASYEYRPALSNISYQPFFLYRGAAIAKDQYEAGMVAKYKNNFWCGGTYRENVGVNLLVGVGIDDRFEFGYAYGYPTNNQLSSSTGSHELNIKFKFGKKKSKDKDDIIVNKDELYKDEEDNETLDKHENEDNKDKDMVIDHNKNTKVQEETNFFEGDTNPFEDEADFKDLVKQVQSRVMGPGNYVVLGVFNYRRNAVLFKDYIKSRNLPAKLGYHPDKKYYYVYVGYNKNMQTAKQILKTIRESKGFKDAWIFHVE